MTTFRNIMNESYMKFLKGACPPPAHTPMYIYAFSGD